MGQVRLYLDQPLGTGQTLTLDRPRAHYLFAVMRLGKGDRLSVFDGRTGEWEAEVVETGKRGGTLTCRAHTRPLQPPPDLWLLFAPIRKARTDFIVEKAVELGAARILPVLTEFTNAERVNRDRLQAHAVEAAEQCGATVVPDVLAPQRLGAVLGAWPAERRLMVCDEARAGRTDALPDLPGPWAILVGPEGGLSDAERARLAALPQAVPVALGPRILRADTAAVAALTLWQSRLGDWA
jgi:16S rRNA (uracil1498-N3)-methyltransferase